MRKSVAAILAAGLANRTTTHDQLMLSIASRGNRGAGPRSSLYREKRSDRYSGADLREIRKSPTNAKGEVRR